MMILEYGEVLVFAATLQKNAYYRIPGQNAKKKKKHFHPPPKKKKNKTVCGEKKDAGRSENLEKGSNSAIYNPRIAYLATIVFQKRHDYSSSLQPGSCINPP